jgi:hypothetical protein
MTHGAAIDLNRPTWWERAACKGMTSLMYAEDQASLRLAVRLCASCAVREPCLADALASEPVAYRVSGVRGGLTPQQRGRQPRS